MFFPHQSTGSISPRSLARDMGHLSSIWSCWAIRSQKYNPNPIFDFGQVFLNFLSTWTGVTKFCPNSTIQLDWKAAPYLYITPLGLRLEIGKKWSFGWTYQSRIRSYRSHRPWVKFTFFIVDQPDHEPMVVIMASFSWAYSKLLLLTVMKFGQL